MAYNFLKKHLRRKLKKIMKPKKGMKAILLLLIILSAIKGKENQNVSQYS